MPKLRLLGKSYSVDDDGFLEDMATWDEDFARGLAPELGIPGGLTDAHWQVIRFIRDSHARTGQSPMVYETCKQHGLSLSGLRELFPTGHWRGACKLAGISWLCPRPVRKTYHIDPHGHLLDYREWDRSFAELIAHDLDMGAMTSRHWEILEHLRDAYVQTGRVPTVYETCDALAIDLEELAELFPSGYQRGAVRMAGLRLAARSSCQ